MVEQHKQDLDSLRDSTDTKYKSEIEEIKQHYEQ